MFTKDILGFQCVAFLFFFATACIKHSIPRLVYTSTYNVVFGGQTIVNGDESLPYFPIEKVLVLDQ